VKFNVSDEVDGLGGGEVTAVVDVEVVRSD